MFLLTGHTGELGDNALFFTPDGQTLVSASKDKTVRLWDVIAQGPRKTLRFHRSFVSGLCLIPGTSLLASGSWDHRVAIWDLTTGKRIRSFNLKASVIGMDASPDGKTLAATGGDWLLFEDDAFDANGVWRWDVKTWKPLERVGEHYTQIGTVRFSPDSKLLITGAADRQVCVWDVESGDRVARLPHTGWIQGLAVSGQTLAVAAGRRVTLWTLPTATESAKQLDVLTAYRGTVLAVAFSGDGRLLATGGKDGVVRIWDMELQRWDHAYRWKIGPVNAVTFAPDGMTMAAGGAGKIVVWDAD